MPVFDTIFGAAPRCHVCSIGIEPNPRHLPRHQKLTLKLGQAGAGVIILPAAVGTIDGQTELRLGAHMSAFEDAGASVAGLASRAHTLLPVRQVRFARILLAQSPPPPTHSPQLNQTICSIAIPSIPPSNTPPPLSQTTPSPLPHILPRQVSLARVIKLVRRLLDEHRDEQGHRGLLLMKVHLSEGKIGVSLW